MHSIFSFLLVCLSSNTLGSYFRRLHLPMITGFMFTGILAGPSFLDFIDHHTLEAFSFIDKLALSYIALVAGGELYWKEIRNRIHVIRWVTCLIVLCVFTFSMLVILNFSSHIPFMAELPRNHQIGIAVMAGAILIARSPFSSAIAVIKEMRAKGSFTQITLGVTVIMDVVVIVIFSIALSFALALISGEPISPRFLMWLGIELCTSVILGILFYKVICRILNHFHQGKLKLALILGGSFGIFVGADFISQATRSTGHSFHLEPLLICLISGSLVTNLSERRMEFDELLQLVYIPIYVSFFTITGASLHLGVLAKVWPIALGLFAVRLFGIFVGSFAGGTICKEPFRQNRMAWMAYVTQAGVGLGLAKAVAAAFPAWGAEFATLIISVIVINEVVGPPLFKWSLLLVGEAHPGAKKSEHNLIHSTIVFGNDGSALALAQQLINHEWKVKVIRPAGEAPEGFLNTDIEVIEMDEFSKQSLTEIGVPESGAVVTMLKDEKNYEICEVVYENWGSVNLVVHLNDRSYVPSFRELGAFTVVESTAIISLLDHYVRTPSAVSLLMDDEDDHDVIDIEVTNAGLNGLTLQELRLPQDVLILSISRKGKPILVHSFESIKVGDQLTLSGSVESLGTVMLNL